MGREVVAYVLVVLSLAAASYAISDGVTDDLRNRVVEVCERAKADRVDNARAWTKAAESWESRANDPQLSPRERRLAGATARVYNETANQLRTRILLCPDLIDKGEHQLDERLLREARGEL